MYHRTDMHEPATQLLVTEKPGLSADSWAVILKGQEDQQIQKCEITQMYNTKSIKTAICQSLHSM